MIGTLAFSGKSVSPIYKEIGSGNSGYGVLLVAWWIFPLLRL